MWGSVGSVLNGTLDLLSSSGRTPECRDLEVPRRETGTPTLRFSVTRVESSSHSWGDEVTVVPSSLLYFRLEDPLTRPGDNSDHFGISDI